MRFSAVLLSAISAATLAYAQGPTSGTGDATFYNVGLGSCGIANDDSQLVAALDAVTMAQWANGGTNPNLNPVCGRQVQITTPAGASVVATVEDTCPSVGCAVGSIDLSPAAFDALADPSVGRITGITWVLL